MDGLPFLTMSYIEGEPLTSRVSRESPLSEREAVRIVRKIAVGMSEAHRRGVLHRDLKPSNVVVDLQGEPVIMDFGSPATSSPDVSKRH